MVGPLLGGVLTPEVGVEVIFRVVAVMAFLGAALVLVMAREDAGTRRETAPGERSPRALLRAAITDLREALATDRPHGRPSPA